MFSELSGLVTKHILSSTESSDEGGCELIYVIFSISVPIVLDFKKECTSLPNAMRLGSGLGVTSCILIVVLT